MVKELVDASGEVAVVDLPQFAESAEGVRCGGVDRDAAVFLVHEALLADHVLELLIEGVHVGERGGEAGVVDQVVALFALGASRIVALNRAEGDLDEQLYADLFVVEIEALRALLAHARTVEPHAVFEGTGEGLAGVIGIQEVAMLAAEASLRRVVLPAVGQELRNRRAGGCVGLGLGRAGHADGHSFVVLHAAGYELRGRHRGAGVVCEGKTAFTNLALAALVAVAVGHETIAALSCAGAVDQVKIGRAL